MKKRNELSLAGMQNLGKPLSKSEQKKIFGGFYFCDAKHSCPFNFCCKGSPDSGTCGTCTN
jgi:hypothetical protein